MIRCIAIGVVAYELITWLFVIAVAPHVVQIATALGHGIARVILETR